MLLELNTRDLALKLLPAALPKVTEDCDKASLQALASAIGLDLQRMMRDHGHHVVAKYLCIGMGRTSLGAIRPFEDAINC